MEKHQDDRLPIAHDRLAWWEDVPLGLALLAQSYVVGLWYYRSISGAAWWLDLLVAIAAGLALDLIVVTTVMGRRDGRSSGWSWATSFGAFACSSLIALDRYGWEYRSALHIAFPLVVFLYSQHLATPHKPNTRRQPTPRETIVTVTDTPHESIVLSKSAIVKQLAVKHGVSESTMWRKVKAGDISLTVESETL